jgi:metallophosphoesterase (TIGR00282 family)
MKILMIGDVYSSVGREMLQKYLPNIVKEHHIDFVIANVENISHGKGVQHKHYEFMQELGVDVMTSGNHVFKNKGVFEYIDDVPNLLRPVNMGPYVPGVGTNVYTKNGKTIRVTNLIGRVFMDPADNPYQALEEIVAQNTAEIHVVDFHAEASAEKAAIAAYFDGQINALVGTHTHVQTADETILPKGTAFLTDLGMTGCYESIIGAEIGAVIKKERTGLPSRFEPAEGKGQLCGAVIEIGTNNQTIGIERIFLKE